MEILDKLYKCSKETFDIYILNEKLKQIQGDIMHSSYYVNENGVKLAYMESSSWGADTIYMIALENDNLKTLEVVNKIMNRMYDN